jgi:hypothetical protein
MFRIFRVNCKRKEKQYQLCSPVRFSVHFSWNPQAKQLGTAFAILELTTIWKGGGDEKISIDRFDGIIGSRLLRDGYLCQTQEVAAVSISG